MKKRITLLMALMMALTLAACSGTGTEDPSGNTAEDPVQTEEEITDGTEPAEEAPEKELDAPAEDETESDGSSGGDAADAENGAAAGSADGTEPSEGQGTSDQKPSAPPAPTEEIPASQTPGKDTAAAQPSQPPAEEASGTAPETPTEETDSSSVDLAAFAASVTGDQETWPGMMAMEGEALDSFYAGLSDIATRQCVVQMAMISASGDEIALVEVENSTDVQAVKDIFQARIDYQVGDGTAPGGAWYPEPTEMWRSESRIVSSGNFVMLVAHTGADSVVEQFNALFA